MRHRSSASELLAWSLVGAAAGLAAGFALGEWLGPMSRQRLAGRLGADAAGPDRGPAPSSITETTRRAGVALAQDPTLRGLKLTPVAVSPGVVELHGWVSSRAERAHAARTLAAAPGIESLVNCLLVRGEDDTPDPAPDLADQPA
jgi:hypothetical protein